MSTIEWLREIMIQFPGMRKHEQQIMQKQINLLCQKLLAVVESADKFIEARESGRYSQHEYEALIASVVACKERIA